MPNRGAKFDLVVFDCDGVLIDSELISARMLIATLAAHGVNVDLSYVARHFLGRSYPVVLSQIGSEFGIDLPESFEADYRARLLSAFERELKIMPGVPDVLDRLAVRSCVATSSSPPRVARSLRIVGLDTRFGADVFTASQVARGKPEPDLFLHVASEMQVAPDRCLVIEDSLNGVHAALAAGMHVCRFTGGSHLDDAASAEPADACAHETLAHFGAFFDLYPQLLKSEGAHARN
ncbi:MAG: HAD family hydrolase [Paracoccaceae bacterium]